MKKARVSDRTLEKMAEWLKLMAHPQRLRMLIAIGDGGAAPVHEVMARTGMKQGAVSGHLARMRQAGLVRAERRGKEVWYDLADRRCMSVLCCMRGKGKA